VGSVLVINIVSYLQIKSKTAESERKARKGVARSPHVRDGRESPKHATTAKQQVLQWVADWLIVYSGGSSITITPT
jgi:hypothetical protein